MGKAKAAQLSAEINMLKHFDIKPNFTKLAVKYGMDRHTVSKYYRSGMPPRQKRNRVSQYDPYREEIEALIGEDGDVSIVAAYKALAHMHPEFPGNYWSFHSYVRARGIWKSARERMKPHPAYETAPGEMFQFDWKEDVTLTTSKGEKVTRQIFSLVSAYSLYHVFVCSVGKGTDDVIRCLIDAIRQIGGLPRRFLTDNMAAVCDTRGKAKRKVPRIVQFEKDVGARVELCKVRTPQTKGKVESGNRFLNRISAYDGRIESAGEFEKIVARIQNDANAKPNQTTGIPPALLLKKEIPRLRPLPPAMLLESYVPGSTCRKVPATLLVPHGGCLYSVPPDYIGKTVRVFGMAGGVAIQHNGSTIAYHEIAEGRKINYNLDDYIGAMRGKMGDDGKIEEVSRRNIEMLGRIGGDAE